MFIVTERNIVLTVVERFHSSFYVLCYELRNKSNTLITVLDTTLHMKMSLTLVQYVNYIQD
jgi:hypothetical protein